MTVLAKDNRADAPCCGPTAGPDLSAPELSLGCILERLQSHPQSVLVFNCEGRDLRPGYHVTEVKDGQFSALDCGANPESWRETFVQLWDVAEDPKRGFMPVGKFLGIMRKVSAHVPFDPAAKLTFEVSDGVEPMRLYKAVSIEADPVSGIVGIALARRPSSCKPRERWLERENRAACCG